MNVDEKRALITKAYNHNDKARRMASCNALYMGSGHTAILMGKLGGEYGKDSLPTLIACASNEQLDAGLESVQNILKHIGA
jgi:hypothetical protein